MGLGKTVEDIKINRPATPRISYVQEARDFTSSAGKIVKKEEIDILARIMSMG